MRGKITCLVLTKFRKLWFCNGYAIKQILFAAEIQERLMVTYLLKKDKTDLFLCFWWDKVIKT